MEDGTTKLLVCERTAGDFNFRGITIHLHSQNNLRIAPARCRSVLDKLATADCSYTGRENNTRVAARCIIKRKLTAVDYKRRAFFTLNNIQPAGVVAAVDRKGAPVVDHRRTGIACRGGHASERQLGGGFHCLANCNVVVAFSADNITVLYSYSCAVCNSDCSLA